MLIACESCHRQYDVGDFRPGAKVRCACGDVRTVPEVKARQVRMLHCSNCGGALEKGAGTCGWCEAAVDDGALRSGELCPECFSTLATGAKYCNDCGVAIDPEAIVRAVSDHGCPVCREPLNLVEAEERSFHQCPECTGVWLDRDSFDDFRQEREAEAEPPPKPLPGQVRRPAAPVMSRAERRRKLAGANLRCPVCRRILLRKPFAHESSIVIDECKAHGFWFDEGELVEIGALIDSGQLDELRERYLRSRRLRRRRARRRRLARRRKAREDRGLIEILAAIAGGALD